MKITTYHSAGYLPAAPAQNRATELDNVADTFTAWNASGAQTTQRALTQLERDRLNAADAAAARDANGTTIRQRAATALAANATYLALPTPNAAQVAAQVAMLTRECSGIIRLLIGQLDSTAGT